MTTNASNPSSVTRRGVLHTAAGTLAAGLVAGSASANTKTPVSPATGRADPHGRFAGRSVVITGGTSGIGKATAYAFAREGALVAFNGRREALGKRNEQEIQSFGGRALYVKSDVRDEQQVEAFLDAAIAAHGRLDIVDNNAGIWIGGRALHETNSRDFADVNATNIDGVYFTMKHAIGRMLRQNRPGGSIVNIASIVGYRGDPASIVYATSKGAVLQMTRNAATDYGPKNIRINSVSPGPTRTDMLRNAARTMGLESVDAMAGSITIGRLGEPEEVARAVMWLASDEASNVHGTDLPVGGGSLLK
ncbi:MAG: SDR family oxidoreductase [Planctomycetota bacterium]